jgi:hypothetical protein
MIKRIMNLFKSKPSEVKDTKIDFEIEDLQKGYFLDYDLKTWQITDFSTYTWDNGVNDFESTLFDGKDKLYLSYETVNESSSIFWEEKIDKIWVAARNKIRAEQDLTQNTFTFENKNYHFAAEGSAKVKSTKETYNLVNWLFESEDGQNLVSFNKYGDGFIEAYLGIRITEHQINNITPGK